MVNLQYVAEADRHNWHAVSKIVRVIDLVPEEFSLVLAHCNYAELQHTMLDWILKSCPVPIDIIHLKSSDRTILQAIQQWITGPRDRQPADDQQDAPHQALMITGLESVTQLDALLKAANQVRDEFRKSCPFPLILWVNDHVLRQMIRLAPDFQSWATTIDFQPATTQLLNALTCGEQQLFDRVLEAGVGRFLNNTAIFGSRYQAELMAALRDLTRRQVDPDPALEASLEFLLGREAYATNDLKVAEERYSRSLAFWQETQDWQRQGCLLYSLGLLWRTWAEHNRIEHHQACQKAQTYFQRCIETFESVQYSDCTAKFINALGEVLQRLERWDVLEQVARRALELHRQYPDPFRLARAYGFLSEVALAHEDWQEAKNLSEVAIATLQKALVPVEGQIEQLTQAETEAQTADQDWERAFHQGWYLLANAQACLALQEFPSAIDSLEKARRDTNPQYDPELYIRILNQLQRVYFQQKKYLQAFKVRQTRRAIEYQFGFRAFLGATRLQPKQTITNPAIAHPSEQVGLHELAASGRQADIDRLVARLSRTDNRLTVLYGQSGVGKSSILVAGLIPTLKQTIIRSRETLPVLQQVYTNWLDNLHEALLQALGERRIPLEASAYVSSLEQIELNDERNLTTVIIFDQFEEFYSACKSPHQRREFYVFLKRCLNIPYVKVIISLREDYLHYLLEITRFTTLDVINNNILDQQILYYIGNFSRQEAKSVIYRLTERTPFSLEPDLIMALVDDLALELNQVSPIELQIVGAQMQVEGITTLKAYQERGPKMALVRRYVDAAAENCGPENQQLAKQILYFLTEEQGTRPLKTRTELAEEADVDRDQLAPVLYILVGAGLVFELPSASIRYYQLVHDYLVPFIRQEQTPELLAELKQTKAQLKQTLCQEKQERKRAEMAEIKVLNALSQALLLSHDQLGALLSSVKAAHKLCQVSAPNDIQSQTRERLWQILNQIREVNRFSGHRATVFDVEFSPDGQFLASASADHTVRLWTVEGTLVTTCTGHRDQVHMVKFSPDDTLLASASADRTVRLWRRDGVPVRTLKGHRDRVFSLCFSPDGQTLASAGEDGAIRLWTRRGDALSTFRRGVAIYNICFSPDGTTLATACDGGKIRLWHLNGTLLAEMRGHEGRVFSVAYSADGQILVSVGEDGAVKRWGPDGTLMDTLHQHGNAGYGVCYSPDNQIIALTGLDPAVRLCNTAGQTMTQLHGHSSSVYGLSFSPDGRLLATAGDDRTVRLWQLEGLGLYVNEGHRQRILDASLSHDDHLATAGEDGTVKLWQLNGQLIRTFHGHQALVRSVSISPDGT
ncbi:MAG: tetratricopeptide repeat protein, partial [Elainellaceae cyanobacterium]